uniref:Peroxin-13 n=1 Tax=Caenorhabditis japonica TaxID=281687 RepID=A0A8R1EMS0_CAEJA
MYGGMGGYGGGYGGYNQMGYGQTPESNFTRLAEEQSRGAFQSIESVVNAVSSVANMLNSTHNAVYSSFRAVIGVVEQFGRLKTQLSSVVVSLALVRWAYKFWRWLLVMLRLKPANYASAAELAWGESSQPYGRYNNTANLGARPIDVKSGDLVVMKNFKSKVGLSRKLVMPWEGLYRITSLERPFAYIVECRRPTKPPRKVHLDQIKKFLETSTSTRPSHQQVDLSPAQLPPIAPSATPMRTSSNIVASPSQNGPKSRAVPSSSSRQPTPSPLVTGTAVNHDDIPCGPRKTRRKP